jgi:glutathionylspermidine amidase/synthetase
MSVLLSFLLLLQITFPHSYSYSPAPFGTLLGITGDGQIEVFSNYVDDTTPSQGVNDENYINGIFTGLKYQCVELARRYWLIEYGVIFESIPNAYDIFPLEFATRVHDQVQIPMYSYNNGLPRKGDLLIWAAEGYYKDTGHVAVVVDVQSDYLDIVEQNIEDTIWPEGMNYSRRLSLSFSKDIGWIIQDTFNDTRLIGWKSILDSQVERIENYQM